MATITGTGGGDTLSGTGDPDVFELADGGDDTIDALGGDDTINMGGGLTGADRIDGGEGSDIIYADGAYDGLVLEAETLTSVFFLVFTSTGDIDVTFDDGNTAAGDELHVVVGSDVDARLDASAETDGEVLFEAGGVGDDELIGGAGADFLNVGIGVDTARGGAGRDQIRATGLDRGDRFDGGDEDGAEDRFSLILQGDSSLRIDAQVRNFESMDVSGASQATLRFSDAVAVDGVFNLFANALGRLRFDGAAEKESGFQVFATPGDDTLTGGRAGDTLAGGDGADRLTGGRGADRLEGHGGGDTYVYESIKDTTRKAPDYIVAFGAGDVADLSAIDADTTADGDQAFRLVSSFSGAAGEAVLAFGPGQTTLSLDVDGNGKADGVIVLGGDAAGFGGFVL